MPVAQRSQGVSPGLPSGLNPIPINTQATTGAGLPSTVTGANTTEQVFPNPAIPSIPAIAAMAPGSIPDDVPFELNASGNCAVNALTTTLALKLYTGQSLVPGSNTLLKALGAITPTNVKFSWWISGKFIYSSQNNLLSGTVEGFVNNQLVAKTAIAAIIVGINTQASPVVPFVVSATFGAGNAVNQANLTAFSAG